MRRVQAFLAIFLFIASTAYCDSSAPVDPKKRTNLGKYITAQESHEAWKATPEGVTILDVRTPEEYVYVGHAPMAINIPLSLWTGKWDAEKKDVILSENSEFVNEVKKRFRPTQMILIMCRSGHRSAKAVDELAKEGFTNVYNVTDGFEGDRVNDNEGYFNGKRVKNGWKNSGAPWTYDLDVAMTCLAPK